ncbi:MAG: helix-turn-helix transcriptional regulator [Treponema sp.]|jgi:DNA-binding CsgD family transcriptional regulator|nr:helix-turn-helix transcriptional regulator [Treponema sp.]
MSISFLASAFMGLLLLGILLLLFYLYTRLTIDTGNLTANINETENSGYSQFIQRLSKRELEVVETVLGGKVSYKEISAALNISVNTVKTHLKHIYQNTGVSSIAALTALFRGFDSNHPCHGI